MINTEFCYIQGNKLYGECAFEILFEHITKNITPFVCKSEIVLPKDKNLNDPNQYYYFRRSPQHDYRYILKSARLNSDIGLILYEYANEIKMRWRAKENEFYHYIKDDGTIGWSKDTKSEADNLRYRIGNYYQDYDKAEYELKNLTEKFK